jgi:hypothetical protein
LAKRRKLGVEPIYFMLESSVEDDSAVLSGDPDDFDPDIDWHGAESFEKSPKLPVRLLIYHGDLGNGLLPELCDVPIPVMSRRLLKVLQECGVSNLDSYEAVITDEASGKQFKSHVAFNLIGAVAAADDQKTNYLKGNPSRMIDADIESLSIDSDKARGVLLFRLAESVNGIVAHARVKEAVEASGIGAIAFLPPEEWIG